MPNYLEKIYIELEKRNITIGVAESVTGGLLTSILTTNDGSSKVFKGSIVAYTNDAKIKLLGVNKETIEKYGAISANTAREMAKGIMKKLKVDIGISITGIAGEKTIENKEVGLFYYCFIVIDKIYEFEVKFDDNGRLQNRIAMAGKIINEFSNIIEDMTKKKNKNVTKLN